MKWNSWFGVILDRIWWRRNDFVFSNSAWFSGELLQCARRIVEGVSMRYNSSSLLTSSTLFEF